MTGADLNEILDILSKHVNDDGYIDQHVMILIEKQFAGRLRWEA